MKGGAVDFIQKPFSYREVLAIIEKAFRRDAEIRAIAARLATLTGRERAVMQRIIEGKPNKLIAADLDISVKTVEYHRAKLMEKTGASSIAELVVFAMQHPRAGAV
jgi:FixJ family two-component response regulator